MHETIATSLDFCIKTERAKSNKNPKSSILRQAMALRSESLRRLVAADDSSRRSICSINSHDNNHACCLMNKTQWTKIDGSAKPLPLVGHQGRRRTENHVTADSWLADSLTMLPAIHSRDLHVVII
ncbi:hypothetical protein MPSEU_001056400 [Mayamaea pseudoterrestris]|nr:hypothetical protein MPSEU_001056400 [Mayamaea pseudoterrestris]